MSMAAAAETAIAMTEIEGRGRSLVASRPLKAGEIILKDSPILLYSALPFSINTQIPHLYCSNCFKLITQSLLSCSSCTNSNHSTLFCSPNCQSIALASSHSSYVCESLRRLGNFLANHHPNNLDLHLQARFLVAAYNLALISPESFRILLSLQGEVWDDDSARFLHSSISTLCPPPQGFGFGFSLELTAALLAKEKLNAFGLMEPFVEEKERSVRAYGIYPKASFFNHDCLPNACRYEYLDSDSASNNIDMIIRVIHDLPKGREICLSYFPVNFKFSDRQKRLKEDYGFICVCDRCKVEANWSDDDEDEGGEAMDEEEEEETEEHNEDEQMVEDGPAEDETNDFPHAYFFLKYMCSRNNCWGTLAPLPPSDSPSNLMECNVCSNLTNDS